MTMTAAGIRPSTHQAAVPPHAVLAVASARAAQRDWSAVGLRDRLAVIRAFRHRLAQDAEEFTSLLSALPHRRGDAESLAAELIPLADAARFLERKAPRILRARRISRLGRPLWLTGIGVETCREPLGVVLVIAPGNYPLMLPGVQCLQALAAGNAVLIKPAPGAVSIAARFAEALVAAGLPRGVVTVLDESPDAATGAIRAGVDKVAVTGSTATGVAVLAQAAATVTPVVAELSGCDAAFVLPGADVSLVARALVFGLTFNSSATCIAPRRVFVHHSLAATLEARLVESLRGLPPLRVPPSVARSAADLMHEACDLGARLVVGQSDDPDAFRPVVLGDASPSMPLLRSGVFAPVLSLVKYDDIDSALAMSLECPFALGASIFGPPQAARELAQRVNAGCVTVNDLIAPTSDPRAPFPARGGSGFGVTRGAEGLLEMTRLKTVITRRNHLHPHFEPPGESDASLLRHLLSATHSATFAQRLAGWVRLIRAAADRKR